jgi:hypothetical protein
MKDRDNFTKHDSFNKEVWHFASMWVIDFRGSSSEQQGNVFQYNFNGLVGMLLFTKLNANMEN